MTDFSMVLFARVSWPALVLASLILLALPCFAAPNVVVTIKPIHSLAAAILEGVAEPKLLLEGAASPHAYALKPSDAEALSRA
ncbi:MAG: zinc ABC transporter substrate-binding protein, partial [Rhodomicrobium sp.]